MTFVVIMVVVGTVVYFAYMVGRIVQELQYIDVEQVQRQWQESYDTHPSTGRVRSTHVTPDYTDDDPELLKSLDDIPDIRRVDMRTGEVLD